jgi:hypothetical protein
MQIACIASSLLGVVSLNAQPPEKKTNNRKAREPLEMAKAKLGDRQSRSAAFRIEGN